MSMRFCKDFRDTGIDKARFVCYNKSRDSMLRSFFGEQAKTVYKRFRDAKSTKQGAVGAICDCNARRLCDSTGGAADDVAGLTQFNIFRDVCAFSCSATP